MTFTMWLLHQVYRSDPVGELAQQVKRTEDWPDKVNSLVVFRVYLARDSATPNAHRALMLAFDEWEKTLPLPAINVPVLLVPVGRPN